MTHHSADTSWDTSDMKAQRGLTALNLLIGLAILAAIIVAVVAITKMDPRGTRTTRTGHRYVKGARAAAAVDQALIGWQESATAMTVDMASPRGIAVDKRDRIYVIGDRLVVLTASGEVALRSDAFAGDYQAVAIGPNGRAFAVTKTRVDVLDIDLRIDGATAQVKSSRDLEAEKVGLASITVTTDGIFVADSYGCRVLRLPHATAQGKPEVFAKGFNVPSVFDLTRSPDGDVVTVDPGRHRVQVRDGYGDVVRSFGQTGNDIADFHGCCNPAAIAIMADGRTVSAEKGLVATRVKVYDQNGQLESVVAGIDAFDDRPDGPPIILDVAVDSKGRILVLDPSRKQVRVFTPENTTKKRKNDK
jgi:hypothetical protein